MGTQVAIGTVDSFPLDDRALRREVTVRARVVFPGFVSLGFGRDMREERST